MAKDYMEELFELRETLRWLLKKELLSELVTLAEQIDRSYVDSYNRIKENSEHGANCGYAAKAKQLFEKFQSQVIISQLQKVKNKIIELSEGPDG